MYKKYEEDNFLGTKAENLILTENWNRNKYVSFANSLFLGQKAYTCVMQKNQNILRAEDIEIPLKIKKFILRNLALLNGTEFVVRSSASCEDSIFFSASGQYESFIGLKSIDEILEAIKKVYYSFLCENSLLYTSIYKINRQDAYMGIIIQPQIQCEKAGVVFSSNPVMQDGIPFVEYSNGNGVDIVSGIKANVSTSLKDNSDEDLQILIEFISNLKQFFKTDIDVEWGKYGDKLFIFQVRPIIFAKAKTRIEYQTIRPSVNCEIINPGYYIGKIDSVGHKYCALQNQNVQAREIPLLLKVFAIIVNKDIKLSHLANICRELNKSLIFSKNVFNKDNIYFIDAYEGRIFLLDKMESHIKSNIVLQYFTYFFEQYHLYSEVYKFIGIVGVEKNHRYEQVVFLDNCDEIKKRLLASGYKSLIIHQKLSTYDFADKSLIADNIEFRTNCDEQSNRIQIKQVSSIHPKFREEDEILLKFDSIDNCKQFICSIGLQCTGEQSRIINRFISKDSKVVVNFIKWPNSQEYFGVESVEQKLINRLIENLGVPQSCISSMDGVAIFNKLKLDLKTGRLKIEEN